MRLICCCCAVLTNSTGNSSIIVPNHQFCAKPLLTRPIPRPGWLRVRSVVGWHISLSVHDCPDVLCLAGASHYISCASGHDISCGGMTTDGAALDARAMTASRSPGKSGSLTLYQGSDGHTVAGQW